MLDPFVAVYKDSSFDAAHSLPSSPGACKHLHGHTYRVEVWVAGAVCDDGVVVDFHEIDSIINQFDHCCLNDLEMFQGKETTAENIARTIAILIGELMVTARDQETYRVKVRVWETPRCYAEALFSR